MKNSIINLFLCLIVFVILAFPYSIHSQSEPSASTPQQSTPSAIFPAGNRVSVKSNNLCVKVGQTEAEKPSACTLPVPAQTVIPGAGGFVHYCQNNTPPWPPGLSQCSLQSSGCGPTSLAMILSSFSKNCNGESCTPAVVDKIMAQNGQRLSDCNSARADGVVQSSWFKNLGMQAGPSLLGNGFDFETAKQRINEGYLIVGSATNAPSCNCNHIFVIQDVDPVSKSITVRDPVCGQNNQEIDFSDKYSNMVRNGTLGWLYAVPVKTIQQVQGVE